MVLQLSFRKAMINAPPQRLFLLREAIHRATAKAQTNNMEDRKDDLILQKWVNYLALFRKCVVLLYI